MLVTGILLVVSSIEGRAQGTEWNLEDCIRYALTKNIQVQKAGVTDSQNQLYSRQAQANRLPSLNASVSQNFNWSRKTDVSRVLNGNLSGSNSTNYSLASNIVVYNGNQLNNRVKQASLELLGGQYYSASVRESVGINILNAYLQVLYATESVRNAEKQVESTSQQMVLAKERMDLGAISLADYLQIKSELAGEKSTLASARSQLSISKVSLMQLMELPVDSGFEISTPNLDSLLVQPVTPDAGSVYNLALGIKPRVRSAELNKESSYLGVKIARAGYLPSLTAAIGITSGYSSLTTGAAYTGQLKDKVSPSLGFSLNIPIFQKKQVKTSVSLANLAVLNAELDELDTKNQLRKEIEQACVDVTTAQSDYLASSEQMQSSRESYQVTNEKFEVGLLNSVDFLVQKNNLITSESKLLQSKFKLIFSYKVLDFYKGIPLVL